MTKLSTPTSSPTGSRRQRLIEQTREEILLSAARLLASGTKAVSLADIAHEIGVTAPALYAYFDSKQAIFAALLRLLDVEIEGVFAARSDSKIPFRQRLLDMSRRHLDLTQRRRDVFFALFALRMRGEEVDGQRPPPPEAHFARLVAWFRREAGPTDLGRRSAEDLAMVFMSLQHGMFVRWMATGASSPLAEQADSLVDYFFHGVSGARSPSRRVRSGRRQPR